MSDRLIRVLGPRVLVALPPEEEEVTTESGLILMRDPDKVKTPTRGIVVALGEKTGTVDVDEVLATLDEMEREGNWLYDETVRAVKHLASAPFDVAVGECVIFSRSSGESYEADGVEYVVLMESDILGVIPKAESEAAA